MDNNKESLVRTKIRHLIKETTEDIYKEEQGPDYKNDILRLLNNAYSEMDNLMMDKGQPDNLDLEDLMGQLESIIDAFSSIQDFEY